MQKGFTLVELMIVVAIIGILSSIAIPAYQDFIVRSKVSEGLVLATAYKRAIMEMFLENPAFFDGNNACTDTVSCERLGIAYISNFEKEAAIVSNTAGRIFIDYAEAVVPATANRLVLSPQVSGVDVDLSSTSNSKVVRWQCRPALTNGIDFRFIPADCRNPPAD